LWIVAQNDDYFIGDNYLFSSQHVLDVQSSKYKMILNAVSRITANLWQRSGQISRLERRSVIFLASALQTFAGIHRLE